MGFKSGEYFGRKRSLAPAWRMAERTAFFVGAEIVHDHDVASCQGRDEDLFDVDLEPLAIDQSVE
jgi:hypothetical protein